MRFKITMREARDVLQLSLLNKAKTEYRSSVLYTSLHNPTISKQKVSTQNTKQIRSSSRSVFSAVPLASSYRDLQWPELLKFREKVEFFTKCSDVVWVGKWTWKMLCQ